MISDFDIAAFAWFDIVLTSLVRKLLSKIAVIYANQVLAVCLNESFHALLADDLIFDAIPAVTSAII